MIEKFVLSVLRFRWLILLLTLLLVMMLAYGAKHLKFSNDYRVFFSEDNPQLVAFENLQDKYSKNDNVFIMITPRQGNVFTESTISVIQELTDRLWQVPYSTRVDSISNFQYTYAHDNELIIEDLFPENGNVSNETLFQKSEITLKEPLLYNRFIGDRKNATGINVTVDLPGLEPTKEGPKVVKYVRDLLKEMESKHPDVKYYLTGGVMLNNAFPETSRSDMAHLIPLAFGVIILGILIFLRSITGVIATILTILFSILAAMGAAGWFGVKLTPTLVSAPTMILTLAVADCIHILTTVIIEMKKNKTKTEAIVESIRINFNPVFITSLTTAIGFMSMNTSDVPPYHDLGNIVAFGIMFAFILSVTFLPALISILPVTTKVKASNSSILMQHIAEFVIKYRKALLFSIGGIIIASAVMVPMNKVNDNFVKYFDKSIEFRRSTDYVTDTLTGVYFIDYSLESGVANGINNPEFLRKVDEFAKWYRSQPEVRQVTVITDIFKRLNMNMHENNESWYKLPENRELAAQYMLLYEMSLPYGLDLNNMVDINKSSTKVTVMLNTLSTEQTIALGERVDKWFRDNAPEIKGSGSSPIVMFSHIAMRNFISMINGTTISLVVISILLILALRSMKHGLLSLIPNLVPAIIAFGMWAFLVGEVGLALSVVIAMTLGIVVDDTVHFLSKYMRAKREHNLDSEAAIRYAFSNVGVALLITTVVLVLGFLVISTSSFELNSGMGLLTAITITIALIVDFMFLPPLLMSLDSNKKTVQGE